MESLLTRFLDLKKKHADIDRELQSLEDLLRLDVSSSLNKIRRITERVLLQLCDLRGVSWGNRDKVLPTIESMIGPLLAAKALPKIIALHVRVVQTYASPASHYQDSPLSGSHFFIAHCALLEFLDWYYESVERHATASGEKAAPPEPPKPPVVAPKPPNPEGVTGTITHAVWRRVRPGVIECSGMVDGFTLDTHIWLAVEIGSLLWPKEPEVQPDVAGAWSGTYFEGGTATRLNLGLWLADAASNQRIYEWLNNGHRTGSYPGLPPSPGMRRIASFENLELA